jgi:phage nucleotide-binding protein
VNTIATATADPLRDKLGVQNPGESITWLNSLIYGEPGTGKTHLLGTAQDHKDTSPLLIIDIDGGVTTLRHRKDIDVIQVRSYQQLVAVYRDLFNAIKDDKLPYGTIGVDTLSELQKLDLGTIAKEFASGNAKLDEDVPDMRAYYKSGEHIRRIVRGFRDLPCNTFFMCHAATDRDNFNRLLYFPHLPGKLKQDIPGFLDIVGWLRAEVSEGEVTRYLQTQKTESVIAKDRTNALDAIEINPTIPLLWDKLQGSNK